MEEEKFRVIQNLVDLLPSEIGNADMKLNLCLHFINLKLLQNSKNVEALSSGSSLLEKVTKQFAFDIKENFIWVKSLQLQALWKSKYRSKDEIKKIHHETIFKNVLPVMVEIIEESLKKLVNKETLYKKIVIFIIMFAGLGSPTQQPILKETQAALNSIFRNSEIENFLTLPKHYKEQQLIEFARLITGIRLFNKDCKKGGEGIEDLPLILSQAVKATKERITSYKNELDTRIDHLVKVFHKLYDEADTSEEIKLPLGFKKKNLEEMKDLLVYFRQLEIYLKNLIQNLDDSAKTIDELIENLRSVLLQVHEVVRYRTAVATVQVFPLFLDLSSVWVQMQEEVYILSEINHYFVELSSIAKIIKQTPLETALHLNSELSISLELPDIIYDASAFYPGVNVCSFSKISEESLQYRGFCAWTLAHTQGVLVEGNISIGILKFQNRFYSFFSPEVAYKWAKNPYWCMKRIISVIKNKVELIELLNMSNDLESKVEDEPLKSPTLVNAQVQTELHPVASYISKDYTFSEWELKKKAIKLAAITNCVTTSQQTIKPRGFKQDIGIQIAPFLNKETQTRRNRSCDCPLFPRSIWKLT